MQSPLKHEFTIVTHSMQQAARCADQMAIMHLGEMIEVGSAEQIFTKPHFKHTEAYIAGRFGRGAATMTLSCQLPRFDLHQGRSR